MEVMFGCDGVCDDVVWSVMSPHVLQPVLLQLMTASVSFRHHLGP